MLVVVVVVASWLPAIRQTGGRRSMVGQFAGEGNENKNGKFAQMLLLLLLGSVQFSSV